MAANRLPICFALLTSVTLLLCCYSPGWAQNPVPDANIRALGWIEPDTDVIDLSSGAGEQRIQALLVEEQQIVTQGQPLVRLVGYEAQAAKIQWIKAQLRTARERTARELVLRQTQLTAQGIRKEQIRIQDTREIKILEHEITALTAELEYRTLELERAKTLSKKEVVPNNIYDLRKMEQTQSQAALQTAQAKLQHQKVLARLNQEKILADQEEILAESRVREEEIGLENLEKELVFAQKGLESYEIASPVDGVILTVLARAGEVPGTSPILKMADIRNMVAIAEVYETDLSNVRLGRKAVVTSPALPKALSGEVVRISRLIFKRTIQTIDPYQPSDYRVAEVRIRLDDPGTASRYIHLQVDVEIKDLP